MLVQGILLALIGLSIAQTYDDNTCGLRPLVSSKDDDKVVGGTNSTEGDWPWDCIMYYNGRLSCGGSIINRNYIVTAAHCTSGVSASLITWDCGLHDRLNKESWTQSFTTKTITNHPRYNSRNITNDISLCQLNNPVSTYTKYVLPACFPAEGTDYTGANSIATGWGTTSSGGSLARWNQQVQMPILTDSLCVSRFVSIDPKLQVCAGVSGGGKDTCQGDSGGPLVAKNPNNLWYLIGLTSWGYGCGDGGVYTRTSGYESWVRGIVGSLPTGN